MFYAEKNLADNAGHLFFLLFSWRNLLPRRYFIELWMAFYENGITQPYCCSWSHEYYKISHPARLSKHQQPFSSSPYRSQKPSSLLPEPSTPMALCTQKIEEGRTYHIFILQLSLLLLWNRRQKHPSIVLFLKGFFSAHDRTSIQTTSTFYA